MRWRIRLEAHDGSVAGVAKDNKISGAIKGQINRVDGMIEDGFQLARGRGPSIDALPVGVDKIEAALAVDRGSRDVEKAAGEFFDVCTCSECGCPWHRLDAGGAAGDGERTDLPLANLDVAGLIVNRIVEGCLAIAVDVEIAKADVPRGGDLNSIWKGLIDADDAIGMEVGDEDVA